jgi:hypothetical protein
MAYPGARILSGFKVWTVSKLECTAPKPSVRLHLWQSQFERCARPESSALGGHSYKAFLKRVMGESEGFIINRKRVQNSFCPCASTGVPL